MPTFCRTQHFILHAQACMSLYESNSISPARQAFKEIKALISEDASLDSPILPSHFIYLPMPPIIS
jgi:hypothetical protein